MRTVRYIFLSVIFCGLWATPVLAEDKSQMGKSEVRTVDWFLAPENKVAMEATLKECNNNPGQFRNDPNCVNAAEANHKSWGKRAGVPKF